MAWYGIVMLFMLVGAGCVSVGILTGLEAKRYKAQIEREKQTIEALAALTAVLLCAKLSVNCVKRIVSED